MTERRQVPYKRGILDNRENREKGEKKRKEKKKENYIKEKKWIAHREGEIPTISREGRAKTKEAA